MAFEHAIPPLKTNPPFNTQAPIIVPKLLLKRNAPILKSSRSSTQSRDSSPGNVDIVYARKAMDVLAHGLQTPKKGDWRLRPDKEFPVIGTFILGDRQIEPHYQPQYLPKIISSKKIDNLYICQWCFRYTLDSNAHNNHSVLCPRRFHKNLPGEIVYEKDDISVRRIDGATVDTSERLFLHDWLQLASCFIQTKAVIMWTSAFDFYLLYRIPKFDGSGPWKGRKNVAWTEFGTPQCVGYNSREKQSLANFNLSCIVILPPWLKLGLFNILAGLSYEKSAADFLQEGPEAPLSEAGKIAYDRLWDVRIARRILKAKGQEYTSVDTLAISLGMKKEELLSCLKRMGCVEGSTCRQQNVNGSVDSGDSSVDGSTKGQPPSRLKPESAIINKTKLVHYLMSAYPPVQEIKKRKREAMDKQHATTRLNLSNPIDPRFIMEE